MANSGWSVRRALRFPLFLLVLFVIARSCSSRASSDSDEADENESTLALEKYKPEIDEGLGASVAIVIDNSGSMESTAKGDDRPKFIVAREALTAMLAATDSFVARQPGFPINVGLYHFASDVVPLVPVKPYDRESLRAALAGMPPPNGGTAIGEAMDAARADLYRAGTFRKYILVVTDGENTEGRSPRRIAREIASRSEGAVRLYFVAFDIDAEKFAFLRDVRGEVLGASNGDALRTSLDEIYRGKILAEAVDAGETLPAARADSDSAAVRGDSASPSKPSRKREP